MSTSWDSYEMSGPLTATVYFAGPGKKGEGRLVFDDSGIRIVPNAEAAWRVVNRASWSKSNRPTHPDGSWKLLFLLSRAYALSLEQLESAAQALGPTQLEDEEAKAREAMSHLRRASRSEKLANDARLHALLTATAAGIDVDDSLGWDASGYAGWFKCLRETLPAEREEQVRAFLLTVDSTPQEFPPDLRRFFRALWEAARKAGEPPTKERVRIELGRTETARVERQLKPGLDPVVTEALITEKGADIVPQKQFQRLLERSGFQWLPQGRPGPKGGVGRA